MIRNLTELYQYRALVLSLTARELSARYRASVLGFLWTFLNPTLNMLVYAVVFQSLMNQPDYPYFLFAGQLSWVAFSSSVVGGVSSVSDRRDLLTKVRFPAQVLPVTVVATNICNYLFSLPLLIALGVYYHHLPSWHLVFFVPVLFVQTLFTLGLVYILSALNVALRDLQHIVVNVITMGFFLTPVLWPISKVPDGIRSLVWLNPMTSIVVANRAIFVDHAVPELMPLAGTAVFSLFLLWVASWIFERRREEFAELV